MNRARENSSAPPSLRGAVLALLDYDFSPARPLIVSPAVYAAAMKDPDLRLRADRMLVNLPLP